MQAMDPVIETLKTRLLQHLRPQKILLFGSRAKSANSAGSDVDLLVVSRHPLSLAQQNALRSLFFDYPVQVDLLFRTLDQIENGARRSFSFIDSVLSTAVVLYSAEDIAPSPSSALCSQSP